MTAVNSRGKIKEAILMSSSLLKLSWYLRRQIQSYTTTSTPRMMDSIEAALAELESLKPGEEPRYTQFDAKYGVV